MTPRTIIKTLSLWQPWASAMARCDKTIETRSWPTTHRGWLAIHAAKRKPDNWAFVWGAHPPLGFVVCLVYMTQCIRTEDALSNGVSETEASWGDYSAGRWAWVTDPDKLIALPQPVPVVGHQGIFNWEPPSSVALLVEGK